MIANDSRTVVEIQSRRFSTVCCMFAGRTITGFTSPYTRGLDCYGKLHSEELPSCWCSGSSVDEPEPVHAVPGRAIERSVAESVSIQSLNTQLARPIRTQRRPGTASKTNRLQLVQNSQRRWLDLASKSIRSVWFQRRTVSWVLRPLQTPVHRMTNGQPVDECFR
jgi:hypothetical protein